jgi:hypothetical protein
MNRQPAMIRAYKLTTALLFCLSLMHVVADDERMQQKLDLKRRERELIVMQRQVQEELQRVHSEQRTLENPDGDHKDEDSYEYPSYCANCLGGDTIEPANKNLLSPEYATKVDPSTRKILQTEKDIRQLSDHSRLEAIKQQILLKLNLNEKPNVTSSIPKQFILDTLYKAGASEYQFMNGGAGNAMMVMQGDSNVEQRLQHLRRENDSHFEEVDNEEEEFDDFYGKTKEIVSFAELGEFALLACLKVNWSSRLWSKLHCQTFFNAQKLVILVQKCVISD